MKNFSLSFYQSFHGLIKRATKRKLFFNVLVVFSILFSYSLFTVGNTFISSHQAEAINENKSTASKPSWWNGNCDSVNNPGSQSHAVWQGLQECNGGQGYYTTMGGRSPSVQEWQCVELAMRYLISYYNINGYVANGKDVVNNFPTSGWPNINFQKFQNGSGNAQHNPPMPGDLISYYNPNDSTDPGHVAYVYYSNVDPGTGNGNITIMQQNWGTSYTMNENVSAWVVQDLSSTRRPSNWLHDPSSTSATVALNNNNEQEIFERDIDGGIQHTWQSGANSSSWSGWNSLTAGTSYRFTGDPAVGNFGGGLQVFAAGIDGNIWTNWSTGGAWSGWSQFSTDGNAAGDPVVGTNSDGRIEVFFREKDGSLWHNAKTCTGSCGWTGWSSLTAGTNYQFADDPTLALNSDGRMEIVVRGMDQAVWHDAQTSAGSSSWTGWGSLGGVALGRQWLIKNSGNGLEIFARGSNSYIYHNWQNTPGGGYSSNNPGSNWSGWNAMQAGYGNDVQVGMNTNGAMEIFTRGSDQYIYHNVEATNGSWSGWSSLIGSPYNFWGDPLVGRNSNGTLVVFVKGVTNQMYQEYQTCGSGCWSGFSNSNSLGSQLFR